MKALIATLTASLLLAVPATAAPVTVTLYDETVSIGLLDAQIACTPDVEALAPNAWCARVDLATDSGTLDVTGDAAASLTKDAWLAASPALWADEAPHTHDIDVFFYGEGGSAVGEGDPCATTSADESCEVPAGASYIKIVLYAGDNVHITATQTYDDGN